MVCFDSGTKTFVLYCCSSDLYSLERLTTPMPKKLTTYEYIAATLIQYANFLSCLWILLRTFWLLGMEVSHRGEIKDQTKAKRKGLFGPQFKGTTIIAVHIWGAPYLIPHRHA